MLSDERLLFLWRECQSNPTAFARAIEAAVLAKQAKVEPVAYLIEDSNGDGKAIRAKDIDKASINRLIAVTVTPLGPIHPAPAPEGMVLVPIARLRSLQSSINGNCYMGQEWEIAQINAMIDASDKESGK